MAARSRVTPRSDRMTMSWPSAMACAGLPLQLDERALEAGGARGDRVEHRQRHRAEPRVLDVTQLGDLLVGQHRVGDDDLPARLRQRLQQVALGADRRLHRGDQLLPDLVERRVGDLREELLEVVEERPRPVGQHGQRGVGAHGADRLLAVLGHGAEQQAEVLVRVAEGDLRGPAPCRGRPPAPGARAGWLSRTDVVPQPVRVGVLGGQGGLDLLVVDDPALGGVDEEDACPGAAAP